MRAASVVAMGFRYPAPGRLEELLAAVASLEEGPVRREMERLLAAVAALELGEWEELHTRTLDLSPLFVPYVGHVTWGESYRRGEFMAELAGGMREAGVDPDGELPDHLGPVLRLLELRPSPDLVEVVAEAIGKMDKELAKAEADNPYRHLLSAARAAVAELSEVKA
jgi:nitrate reductase delta subunit